MVVCWSIDVFVHCHDIICADVPVVFLRSHRDRQCLIGCNEGVRSPAYDCPSERQCFEKGPVNPFLHFAGGEEDDCTAWSANGNGLLRAGSSLKNNLLSRCDWRFILKD